MKKMTRSQPDDGPRGMKIPLGGTLYERVRFGKEFDHWAKTYGACPDCATLQGGVHEFPCDVEECPACGGQLIDCGCLTKPSPKPEPPAPANTPDKNQIEFGL